MSPNDTLLLSFALQLSPRQNAEVVVRNVLMSLRRDASVMRFVQETDVDGRCMHLHMQLPRSDIRAALHELKDATVSAIQSAMNEDPEASFEQRCVFTVATTYDPARQRGATWSVCYLPPREPTTELTLSFEFVVVKNVTHDEMTDLDLVAWHGTHAGLTSVIETFLEELVEYPTTPQTPTDV